jgi:hypothetical protein
MQHAGMQHFKITRQATRVSTLWHKNFIRDPDRQQGMEFAHVKFAWQSFPQQDSFAVIREASSFRAEWHGDPESGLLDSCTFRMIGFAHPCAPERARTLRTFAPSSRESSPSFPFGFRSVQGSSAPDWLFQTQFTLSNSTSKTRALLGGICAPLPLSP